MRSWKCRLIAAVFVILIVSLPIFLVTGYFALYLAWVRGNLTAALPYLPWARNAGMLAMLGATMAFAILFSPRKFVLSVRMRLWLSLLATVTIASFSEFRNDGKFHFRRLVHFFGPGTWAHDGLNHLGSSFGDLVYRIEYSHWNDFLMGPAIISVLFSLLFAKLYGAFRNQETISLAAFSGKTGDLEDALRFARTLMNVGLFWFFIQAWAEKAGYLSNPHSKDEIDLPFEFAGTMVGFWMARVLTRPFDDRAERFRSTFWVDLLSSGVIGLLYTFIVGPLTENVAGAVAHALYPVVPGSLELREYTPLQQHMRPFELLLLAGAVCWGLNRVSTHEELNRLSADHEEIGTDSGWDLLITVIKALGVTAGYLIIVVATFALLEPEGLGWTLATLGAGVGAGIAAFLTIRRASRRGFTTVFKKD